MKIVALLSIVFLFFVSTTNGQVFDMFDTTEDVVDDTTPRVKKDYEGNTWTVEGDTLTKYVNGRQVFQYIDPKGATLTLPGFSTFRNSNIVKYIHVGTDDGRIVQFDGKKRVFNSQTGVIKTGVSQTRTWGPFKWKKFGGGGSGGWGEDIGL